jgi:hypothetical protein
MSRKLIALSLVLILSNVAGVTSVYGTSKEEKEARFAEKVRTNVLKLGTGERARVKVKLRDKTKVEGYISAADDEGFSVTDSKTGTVTRVVYPQVKSVKGNNLSTGVKVAIGAGAAAVIIFLILWFTTGPGSD